LIRFVIKRIFLALVQIFIVLSLVFMLLHIMPGDPAVLALGTERTVDPQVVEALRHELGLDKPILEQYLIYIKNVVNLDFGNSITDKIPVMDYISQRIPRTIELAFLSIILASIIGVALGMVSALKRKKAADIITTSLAALGISLPVFVLGTLFIFVFSFKLRWLPSGGFVALSRDPWAHYLRFILPQ
jgi:peptide/nickel transport system permease protein